MSLLLFLCVIGIVLHQGQSYVLLQVSKDEQNRSNVDALIHKIVPSDQYDRIAEKIASNRKQFPPFPTRLDHPDSVYSRTEDREENQKRQERQDKQERQEKEDRQERHDRAREDRNEIDDSRKEDLLTNLLTDLIKPVLKPIMKSVKILRLEPEVVNFRSNKPSLLYEVSADTFVQAIKDILQSKTVHQYVEEIAKRAAAVYRSFKDPNY